MSAGYVSLSRQRRRALRLCLWESGFSQTFTILTGGAFLVGYALELGAGPFLVAVLAAIPFYAQAAQLAGAWITDRIQRRRPWVLVLVGLGRLCFLALVPIVWLGPGNPALAALMVAVTLGSLLAFAGAVPWLSWLGDLIPRRVRGRWISSRQQVLGVMTAIASLGGGWLLDRLSETWSPAWAFTVLLGLGGLAALISQGLLALQPEPQLHTPSGLGESRSIGEILRRKDFRRLLRALFLWNVAIGVSAPFFALYMFVELGMTYLQVALYQAAAALVALFLNPFWGKLVDRFGVRPVLLVNAFLIVLVPLLWFFPAPGMLWPVWVEAVYSGVVWTGFHLAAFSLPFAATPSRGRPWFLAFLSLATGCGYATAALGGGWLGSALEGWSLEMPWGRSLLSYHLIFTLSAVLRFLAALGMRGLEEPGSHACGTMIQVVGFGVLRRLSLARPMILGPPSMENSAQGPEDRHEQEE